MKKMHLIQPKQGLTYFLAMAVVVSLLGACSGGSGKQGRINTAPPAEEEESFGVTYNGPSPANEDIQSFKRNVWDNLAAESRCGSCHIENVQSPEFVRSDDINLAYTAANTIIQRTDIPNSDIITKVSTGHGCWSTDPNFCVERVTSWVTAWASESGVPVTETALQEPSELFEVSASLTFPETTASFEQHVYPLLSNYCSDCHRADAPQAPVQPYFSSTDVPTAYLAAQTKMLFNTTETANGPLIDASRSRLVLRLTEEAHNCWNNDCNGSGNQMEAALEAFAATMELRELDSSLVTSKAMRIGDGTAISQGGRVESNAIAIYPFKAGKGTVANDYSDFEPALNLNLIDSVEWVSNWGVRINNGRVQGSVSASKKLHRYITQSGEYSIEAWAVPANVTQDGPARIVSYSGSNAERNFTLGQTLYNYDFFNRTNNSDANGTPLISTPDAAEVLQATLQHVVVTFDVVNGRRIYVNGELIETTDPTPGGNLNEWDENFVLVLGNETSGEYPWQGTIRFLAIHSRALSAEQVLANYDVGVGQKILVAFSISHLVEGISDAYIVFQVEQFDDYSYLLNEPFFYSFGGQAPTSDIRIQGLRIGVNGREAKVGQAFANMDITINSDNYDAEGVPLSTLGTVIELEKGPEQDQFFLSFDQIGSATHTREEQSIPAPTPAQDLDPQPRIGVRHFAEINASLSAMTGVPVTHSEVVSTFEAVQQQMPVDENVKGFLVAHQMGITQLAVKYCNVLANDSSRMQSFFPNFNGSTFDTAGRNGVIDPLLAALVAHDMGADGQLTDQPLEADSRQRLNDLIDTMTSSCSNNVCSASVSANTVTAVCAAALGSAVMLIQ